jgi:hypothetical protein
MAVTRADKALELEQLEKAFKGSDSAILVDYKGLTVPQVTELRRRAKAKAGLGRGTRSSARSRHAVRALGKFRRHDGVPHATRPVRREGADDPVKRRPLTIPPSSGRAIKAAKSPSSSLPGRCSCCSTAAPMVQLQRAQRVPSFKAYAVTRRKKVSSRGEDAK